MSDERSCVSGFRGSALSRAKPAGLRRQWPLSRAAKSGRGAARNVLSEPGALISPYVFCGSVERR